MKIEGIIFDLDGTLLHTIEDLAAAANLLFVRHSLPEHEIDFYLKWIGNGAVRFIEKAIGKDIERELLLAYVLEFKEIYSENLHNLTRIYDGIPGVLNEIKKMGLRMAVLSNKPHTLTQDACTHYLSDWPLDPILGQRENIPRKPDPAAALEIAELWKMNPSSILFVGDSDNDILTASSAGMPSLAVNWGYGRLEEKKLEGQVKLIHTPEEILNYLKP